MSKAPIKPPVFAVIAPGQACRDDEGKEMEVMDSDGKYIGRFWPDIAAHVVTVLNNHDKLVEALARWRELIDLRIPDKIPCVMELVGDTDALLKELGYE